MPSIAPSASVRSAQTSTTSRARSAPEVGEDAVVLVGEADDLAAAEAGTQLGLGVPGACGGTSRSTPVASDGNRFSKTTTW